MKTIDHEMYKNKEPEIFIGFSELDDDDYEREKEKYIPEYSDRKKSLRSRNKVVSPMKNQNGFLGVKREMSHEELVETKKKKVIKDDDDVSDFIIPELPVKNEEIANLVDIPQEIIDENGVKTCDSHSFPLSNEACYYLKDLDIQSLTQSYANIKEIVEKKSIQIKGLFYNTSNRYIIQLNLKHLSLLNKELETSLSTTKLWYHNERSYSNLLNYSHYDVVGVTIPKVSFLPEMAIYYLNKCNLINFRTVIVNLGPGYLTHIVIAKEYINCFIEGYMKKYQHCYYSKNHKDIITIDFLNEYKIPYSHFHQNASETLVLEPGVIHLCNTSRAPTMTVHWCLLQATSTELAKTKYIQERIATFNISPTIPLMTLRLDMLIKTIDSLPIDSIKNYYYEMQTIIVANSLDKYMELLIEEKVILMHEVNGTIASFCDDCHREIFNYYSIKKGRKLKINCLKCFCHGIKNNRMETKILVCKYFQRDLDAFLNKMKEKLINSYISTSVNQEEETVYSENRSIGFIKPLYQKNLSPQIKHDVVDSHLGYNTYSPYEQTIETAFKPDLITHYLISQIDKEKGKYIFSKPLALVKDKYPYTDYDNINENLTLVRFSPSYNDQLIFNPKENKSLINSILSTKDNNANPRPNPGASVNILSKKKPTNQLHHNLIGSSIFDFAKKVVTKDKAHKSDNNNFNQAKFEFAEDSDSDQDINGDKVLLQSNKINEGY